MQKICAIVLLSALASNYEALPQTKWSRPIRNPQGELTRERRQFPFGEWIPLNQACPTCRQFADPLDVGLRGENIGLTPPRPPTVTRQIHGEGNFFPQDDASILSVPPPPPSALPRHPIPNNNGNFQFSTFGQPFNNPLPVPTQKVFPQSQPIQFLPQSFLPNQPLLVNGNQPILPGLNTQGNLFGPEQGQQQINSGKVNGFNSEFKTQKIPENVVLEQNNRPLGPKQVFPNKPQPFATPQHNQQQNFIQQQSFGGQQQHSVNFGNSILTPPPAPKNVTQDIVIPGLDKEEIQLLYVPVETLRQRGTPQEQLLTQQPQNVQFFNRGNGFKRPVNNIRPTEQTITPPKGHFVTQNGNGQGQTDSGAKVTSAQPFPSSVTPSTLLLQHLPFQQTPQPFVSATPATPTVDPFVTPASVFPKFSSFSPDTTLPHLSTVPNTIQFSQSDIEFGTTPKTLTTAGEIVPGKSQFPGLKNPELNQDQIRPFQQPFVNQQQAVTQPPQLTTVFSQQQQKDVLTPTHFPNQIDQQQIALQKQQEHQRLLQQQRQNELEEKRILDQQRKQKELEEQRILQQKQQQHQKELEEQRILQQQKQRQKELEEQRLLQQQQRQKELEQQRFLQKQKKLEEQRLLQQQQRQKELEQQRFLQKQKELEEQRLLQQQRQKELEQQRYIQKQKELEEQRLLQRQKELEEQRLLQRQKELEEQRFLAEQRQKELENQRRLQLKQKEEERLARLQQQQKELEQQRLLQQQQELQRQKQENLKKFQIFKQQHHQQQLLKQQQEQQQLLQQQQQQEQQQLLQQQQEKELPQQQVFQQTNRHVLPANDNANFIPQLEKESELEEQQLVPHQPPLSVFFKGNSGVGARITDVLRELRNSNTITVLDQYFDKMPKVFVGPAGLLPPAGYEKFELPYLSNLESNRIERRIGKLPFFVAPLNFVPPPGYAKIPFPAPHVGSVVVSSESNPAMTLKSVQKGSTEEETISGSFPVVGPELPGLINNLDTQTTTLKPTTYVSTPSLPQTTAQLRSRRPNNSIYKPQNRKPITRTRPTTTTSKPEEEVTQPIQKLEPTKEPEGAIRRPFNRFLNRRRQQTKTTTPVPLKSQQDGKSLENRQYSIETYQEEKNQVHRTQPKSDVIQVDQNEGEQFTRQFEHTGSIDRTTPEGDGVFEVRPTPDFFKEAVTSEENQPEIPDYADVNLQNFEDGPLPTGSAKTITQELYRPNAVGQTGEESNSKTLSKLDSTPTPVKYPASGSEELSTGKFPKIPDPTPTADLEAYKETVSEEEVSLEPTGIVGVEKQDTASERFDSTESSKTKLSFSPGPTTASGETKGFLDSSVPYTSALSEISRPQHAQGFVHPSQKPQQQFPSAYPTPDISLDLQAPEEQQSQEFDTSSEVKPTQNSGGISSKFPPTASSNEQYLEEFERVVKNQQPLHASTSQVSPTVSASTEEQYTTGGSLNSQETNKQSDDERIGSFVSVQGIHSTLSPQYFPSSTAFPSQAPTLGSDRNQEFPVFVEQSQPQLSSTPQAAVEVTINPSVQTYTTSSTSESSAHVNDRAQTDEGHGQDVANNLPNDHRLKLPNPSIVRVRTRVRGKQRGQVNFSASQSTTPAAFTRLGPDGRHNENTEQEITTKANNFREYHPVKTSKFNQFRGVKKPVRTTTEAPVEQEQKTPGVYTIRPPRRPLNPSTVSTKRIRRPTTPLPSAEAATEAFEISTTGSRSQPDHSDISPSGVSNDVYYEQSSFSPVKHKFRKHFASAEQKNDVVPAYVSTSFPTTAPTHPTPVHEEYSEETRELSRTQASADISEKYPEWNPSESGFDVSGIVLTTARSPAREDQAEAEEPKKTQDNKKAFDPDLEKKTGRRRVRVRVHKRPHENFETAESQNLRTVANVLVPPTTTYKPNDESSFHELAKNVDFSFGGQKLFGSRSREYFRKRLNLTQHEGIKEGEQSSGANPDPVEKKTEAKYFVRKAERGQKNEFESVPNQSNESGERSKTGRPKFRGFVRKVIKHGTVNKEVESDSNQLQENEDNGDKSVEYHSRQAVRGGFNHTGRVNGTRHKTFVRYVKKNKVRQHEPETIQESSSQEPQEQGLHQTTESHTTSPVHEETSQPRTTTEIHDVKQENAFDSQSAVFGTRHQGGRVQSHQETESLESQQEAESPEPQQPVESQESPEPESTEEPEVKQTQRVPTETTKATEFEEVQESSSQTFRESVSSTVQPYTPQTQLGSSLTQRPKFYQTLRPTFHRPTAFQRSRETESTTAQNVQEPQEKRSGYSRFKYGKPTGFPTGFGTTSSERSDETKKVTEPQVKSKNLHALEVRKYLRTKNREGGFSHFSKNKYFTSEKTETVGTTEHRVTDQESVEQESEEITTEREVRTSSAEPKTTEAFVPRTDSAEVEDETTEHDDELELQVSTTEAITLSKEVNSEEHVTLPKEETSEKYITSTKEGNSEEHITLPKEENSEEHITLPKEVNSEDITTPVKIETTTEIEVPTTYFHPTTTTETPEKATEPKIQTTEAVEAQRTEYEPDIYRFSKNSFSFDETEKFTGTKNRGHVRNITTDIIENTASFSAPGVEKRPDIRVVTHRSDEDFPTVTDPHSDITEKTEVGTTDFNKLETTTDYPETETVAAAADAVTKDKAAKVLKTSTTTKVSHETEICYRGKCIRTKSENPDEDLKLLVDSASTVKTEKTKT